MNTKRLYWPSFSRTVAYREFAKGHDWRLQRPVTLYSLRQKFWVVVLRKWIRIGVYCLETETNALDFIGAELVIYYRPDHVVALHIEQARRGELETCNGEIRFVWFSLRQPPAHVDAAIRATLSRSTMSLRAQLSSYARRIPSTRQFSTSLRRSDFHFDTHHFVQRLEREGLNRAQAEGIMSAMAEVIDESVRNMTSNMVTKAEQEKARIWHPFRASYRSWASLVASLYPTSRLCSNKIRASINGKEWPRYD